MRIVELIEDANGKLSTPAVVILTGVAVLSFQVVIDAINGNTDSTVVGIYAGLVTTIYGIKKGFDTSVTKATINSASPIRDVNLKAEGDVTVNN